MPGRGCHRAATTVQQRRSIMLASDYVIRGRSRRSAGGARLPAAGWRPGGGGKPVELRAPGGIRRARVAHRMPPNGASRWPLVERAGVGGHPRRPTDVSLASVGAAPPGSGPETFGRGSALTLGRTPARVTHPSERPPLALRQPKETLRRRNSSGTVLRDTRHQHRLRQVCARSLLENGIVRAKSQCGQFIRTQTDGLYVN